MLSKKMAVSLTSLITILAFVVSPAMAHENAFHVKVPDRVDFNHDNAVDRGDFSHRTVAAGFKVMVRQDPEVAQYALTAAGALDVTPIVINLDVEFAHAVGVLDVNNDGADDQITFLAFDSVGGQVAAPGIVLADVPFGAGAGTYHRRTASRRRISVTLTPAAQATPTAHADRGEVNRIVISFAQIQTIDPTVGADSNMSASGTVDITVHQSTAQDSSAVDADFDTPRVVSIQRLRPGSQTVVAAFQEAAVTGPFTVRIVLSEAPAGFGIGNINVANGRAIPGTFVVGTPFRREGTAVADVFAPTRAELLHTTKPHPREGMYEHDGAATLADVPAGVLGSGPVPYPTGDDLMYHQYRVGIEPHRRATRVVITIGAFHDGASPYNNYYQPGVNAASTPNGREKLDLRVALEQFTLEDGYKVILPHNDGARITYANGMPGHYILTKNKDGSSINYFNQGGDVPRRENVATEQTPAQLLYNVRAAYGAAELPADSSTLPNLETFLGNHGTIHLVSYGGHAAGDAYISEVMWGTDASLEDVSFSNWIEIRNGTGSAIGIAEGIWALWFYEAHETPATAYPEDSPYEGPTGQAGTLIDAIGTKDATTGRSWSLTNKGQSGRTNIDIARSEEEVLAPTTPLRAMYRVMNADGTLSDGTMSSNWMQSTGPSVNFKIGRENAYIATPGADEFDTPDETAQANEEAQDILNQQAADTAAENERIRTTGTYPMAGDGRIYISEVMFAGGGTLPQWIEISNGDRAKDFNLSGWTLTIDNAIADVDVVEKGVGARATFTIPDGTMIHYSGQKQTPSTVLVVTEAGRTNMTGPMASGQIINLDQDNEVELILAGVLERKYRLLSSEAFLITLAPPEPEATTPPAGETAAAKAQRMAMEKEEKAMRMKATDTVGNLGANGAAAWALPVNADGGRSSIIRRHIQVARGPAAPEKGTMEESWVLASKTSFAQVTHIRASSYYGAANDVGTPGFRPGGALPVELSHFRPARDKATDQVVITWSTQSELNNAGFFIKRSQQPDGEFKVINTAMVPGAGTTSEKQFYTYTDTTAQPNVVYYYQIEDVSLDGNRQTLTRSIRLKGHVGAAGKATTLWGELKTSHE